MRERQGNKQGDPYDYYRLASPAGAEVKMVGEKQLARFIRAQRVAE